MTDSTSYSSEQVYNFTFTAASLRPELARIISEIYLKVGDWEETKKWVLKNNALQARTPSSAIRMEREFRQRLQTLTCQQTEILATAPSDSRMAVAWLAVIKHSAFIFDFVAEVLRSKFENLDPVLRPSDYENFFQAKSVSHPEMAALTPATQTKVQRVVKTMLREVGILGQGQDSGSLQRPLLPPDVLDAIVAENREWLAGFLVPDSEIASVKG